MRCRGLFAFVLMLVGAGCANRTSSPSTAPTIAVSIEQADRILEKMAKDRKPLDRPLVICNGYLDPGLGGAAVQSIIRQHVDDSRIITVSFWMCSNFDECRAQLIRAVD